MDTGTVSWRTIYYTEADRLGMPLIGSCGNIDRYYKDIIFGCGGPIENNKNYKKEVTIQLREIRNHPSVLMWSTSGNQYGFHQNYDPRVIGFDPFVNVLWDKKRTCINTSIQIIKENDPTRPVFVHESTLGDADGVGLYLNFVPLQEREDWLIRDNFIDPQLSSKLYCKTCGPKPFICCEFGTPYWNAYMRGRTGAFMPSFTEPLLTEYAAIYFGPQAYNNESRAYRDSMRTKFEHDQVYTSFMNDEGLLRDPNGIAIQELFIKNTWRSWRATGCTGGIEPQDFGLNYYFKYFSGEDYPDPKDTINKVAPFVPGTRGPYYKTLLSQYLHMFRDIHSYPYVSYGYGYTSYTWTNASKSMYENNGPTLAYIAGKLGDPTDKTHNFYAGKVVKKQIALFNDTTIDCEYSANWKVIDGSHQINRCECGVLAVSEKKLIPIEFTIPWVTKKTDGKIILEANIDNHVHRDTFLFREFPPIQNNAQNSQSVMIYPYDSAKYYPENA